MIPATLYMLWGVQNDLELATQKVFPELGSDACSVNTDLTVK